MHNAVIVDGREGEGGREREGGRGREEEGGRKEEFLEGLLTINGFCFTACDAKCETLLAHGAGDICRAGQVVRATGPLLELLLLQVPWGTGLQ